MSAGAPHVVCTLASGSYFHGAAALINSLVRQGFEGEIVVGYTGPLPAWRGPVQPEPNKRIEVDDHATVRFLPLRKGQRDAWSIVYRKAEILLSVSDEIEQKFESLWFFDADIVIETAWSNLVRWVEGEALLIKDICQPQMQPEHAFRKSWAQLAAVLKRPVRPINGYFNAGCVGITPASIDLIAAWAEIIELKSVNGFAASSELEFWKEDQDLLNAAIMMTAAPFRTLDAEAMGVFPSISVMQHAMFFEKPWSRQYVRDALKGYPPDAAHRAFWTCVDGPIHSFAPAEESRRRRLFALALALRHFRRRTVREW